MEFSKTFDQSSSETINNLQSIFNNKIDDNKPSLLSNYSIGIEIEVKFRYYFPEIFKEYFIDKKWDEYNDIEKEIISSKIETNEKVLLPLLESTVIAGIPKGNDKYWEFAFNPVNDLTLLYYQIEILKSNNLIPEGEHSLHISIGGLKPDKKLYHILMILELLFLKKERILSGFDFKKKMNGTWAKKGRAGIFPKFKSDLIDSEIGSELRTLCIYNDTDVYSMFTILHYMLHNNCSDLINQVLNKMSEFNLPDVNWENIHKNIDIWTRYHDNFEILSNFTKKLVNNINI